MVSNEWGGRLGRQVKLRELLVFLAVMDHGSFRKAARFLHLTQPAVTAAVAELERTLGVPLFDRTSQGVIPTVHAASFVRRASAIFGELSLAAEDLEAVSRGDRQVLRVGAGGGGWAQGILPKAISHVLGSRRDVLVVIREADEEVLLGMLKARALDVCFSRLEPTRPDQDLAFHTLFEDAICILARSTHRLAGLRKVTYAELADEDWVTPQWGALSYDHIQRTLHRAGHTMPRHAIESASASVALGMVLEAGFLCFGTFHYHANSVLKSMLTILNVDLPRIAVPFGAVTLRHREPDPLATRLIEAVAEIAKESTGVPRA